MHYINSLDANDGQQITQRTWGKSLSFPQKIMSKPPKTMGFGLQANSLPQNVDIVYWLAWKC